MKEFLKLILTTKFEPMDAEDYQSFQGVEGEGYVGEAKLGEQEYIIVADVQDEHTRYEIIALGLEDDTQQFVLVSGSEAF